MSKQFETTHWDADKVRSQGEKSAQNHRRRKNKKFNWGIYIACVVLGSVVLASLGWLLANDLCSLNKKDVTVTIEVTEGETLGQVARQLKQEAHQLQVVLQALCQHHGRQKAHRPRQL